MSTEKIDKWRPTPSKPFTEKDLWNFKKQFKKKKKSKTLK